MPEAGEIFSNMKRSELSYDEELPTPVIDNPLPYTDSSSQELIEEEQRMFEDNYRAAHAQRWEGQERWMGKENEEMRLVNILHPHAIFKKLQDAGINCSIEPQVTKVWDIDHKTGLAVIVERTRAGGARFWLHDLVIQDRVGISAWVWRNGERVAAYSTYLQYPKSPEWSVMRFNELDVPTCEKYRGWRTALLKMMMDEVITEEEVNKAFGAPVVNAASELYYIQLEELRKTRRGVRP
jgi:hypothetical protein